MRMLVAETKRRDFTVIKLSAAIGAAVAGLTILAAPAADAHETSICAQYETVPAGYIVWSIEANARSCGGTHRLNIKNDIRREDAMCEGYNPVPSGYRIVSVEAGVSFCAYRNQFQISNRNS
ncbi:hypothetical protein [Amycolatopsis sp. NPDC004378]